LYGVIESVFYAAFKPLYCAFTLKSMISLHHWQLNYFKGMYIWYECFALLFPNYIVEDRLNTYGMLIK
jgi:hypothetical protein